MSHNKQRAMIPIGNDKPAFTFLKRVDNENRFSAATIRHDVHDHDIPLPDLLEAFQDFLRGCGYMFEGTIEVVPDGEA